MIDKYCSNCGSPVNEEELYCSKCGNLVKISEIKDEDLKEPKKDQIIKNNSEFKNRNVNNLFLFFILIMVIGGIIAVAAFGGLFEGFFVEEKEPTLFTVGGYEFYAIPGYEISSNKRNIEDENLKEYVALENNGNYMGVVVLSYDYEVKEYMLYLIAAESPDVSYYHAFQYGDIRGLLINYNHDNLKGFSFIKNGDIILIVGNGSIIGLFMDYNQHL